jgi:hypothetical protein
VALKGELKVLYRLPPTLPMPDRYETKRRNDKVQNAAQGYRLPDQYELKRKMNEVEKDISIYPDSPPFSLPNPHQISV